MNILLRWHMKAMLRAAMAFIMTLAPTIAFADTINSTNGESLNGKILTVTPTTLTIIVDYVSSGSGKVTTEQRSFSLKLLESLEFNSITLNDGGPKRQFGFGPPSPNHLKKSKPSSTQQGDELLLRGGEHVVCGQLTFDGNKIRCTTGASYLPIRVIRAELGVR